MTRIQRANRMRRIAEECEANEWCCCVGIDKMKRFSKGGDIKEQIGVQGSFDVCIKHAALALLFVAEAIETGDI